jgi:hypothetical protein
MLTERILSGKRDDLEQNGTLLEQIALDFERWNGSPEGVSPREVHSRPEILSHFVAFGRRSVFASSICGCRPQQFLGRRLFAMLCRPQQLGLLVRGRNFGGTDEAFDFGKLTCVVACDRDDRFDPIT